jgi:hypothetical protein
MTWQRHSAALAASFALGCGTGEGAGYSLNVGGDEVGPSFATSGMDGSPGGFDAYIERNQVGVKFIALDCAGDCATVEAVGVGGYPPYTFAWDDGSNIPTRKVCPTSSTDYSVKVTDTGNVGESSRPPDTATASLTADVLNCPDASSSACGDAGSPGGGVRSGHYVGTVYCPPEGGVINAPTTDGGDSSGMLTLDLSVNGTAVGGSLYFIWSIGGAIAWQADLAGALECPAGDLQATWENAQWGLPSTGPDGGMTIVPTGTGTGSITAATMSGAPDTISGSFDFTPQSGGFCRGTYSAAITP